MILAGLLALAGIASADLEVPKEYHGNTGAVVLFMEPQQVNKYCGNTDPDWIVYACAWSSKKLIVMPNPCNYPEAKNTDSYAYLMCHEKAHLKGWKHPQ